MQLSFEITLAEFKSALKLYSRGGISRRVYWFIYDYVIPGTTLAMLVLTVLSYISAGANVAGSFLFIDAALVSMTVLLMIVRRMRMRSMFRALVPPGASSPVRSLTFSEDQILSRLEGIGETRYLWTAICGIAQNEQVILLFISREQFLLVPACALSTEQHSELDKMIVRHVIARKPC
jgi:hypothetical protein